MAYRIGYSEEMLQRVPQKDPIIIKTIMNDLVPKKLKKLNDIDNKCFSDLFNSQKWVEPYDFGAGVYEGMPEDPRGQQLLMMRLKQE